MRFVSSFVAVAAAAVLSVLIGGCRTVESDVVMARASLQSGNAAEAVRWSDELADESVYSRNLGLVESGRVRMLTGDWTSAERRFRQAVDSAIDRREAQPRIKLGDVGNEALSATVTDDRTRNYYLVPYELNLALEYAILAQLVNGRIDDALADARLAVVVQDSLAKDYGEDLKKVNGGGDTKAQGASGRICASQSAALQEMMASTRNSWENPVLWWLTGVIFEADGDLEMAWQSYRKAAAVRPGNPVFAAEVVRADANSRIPASDKARLVVIYEEGLIPMRESLKIPVPIYTGMSIDLPMYTRKSAYVPGSVSVSGVEKPVAASPALDIRALAVRDLDERMPGVVVRNITRAAVQAGAQAAVNLGGNDYAKLAVLIGNAVVSMVRRSDTRSWVTLPDGQQIWDESAMKPGEYRIGVSANGRTATVPLSLKAGETHLLWIADDGRIFRTASARIQKGK